MPLVEPELLTLPEHLSSPRFSMWFMLFNLYFSVHCFVDRCLSFCPFSFGQYVVWPSLSYGFWLPFGNFKIFLSIKSFRCANFRNWIIYINRWIWIIVLNICELSKEQRIVSHFSNCICLLLLISKLDLSYQIIYCILLIFVWTLHWSVICTPVRFAWRTLYSSEQKM